LRGGAGWIDVGAVLCGSSGGDKGRNMSNLRSVVWEREMNARATGAKKKTALVPFSDSLRDSLPV
jgi:hypothetical protein